MLLTLKSCINIIYASKQGSKQGPSASLGLKKEAK
jgi:hypothetical protein